jgi:WD40 repeat protein
VSYALPRKLLGEVQVRRRRTPGSVDVRAHDSAVACIALSRDGRLLATAGTRGTLVRVFSTADGSKLQEVCMQCDMNFYFVVVHQNFVLFTFWCH